MHSVCAYTEQRRGRTQKESGRPLGVMTREPEDSTALSLSEEFSQSKGNTRETMEEHCMLAHPQAHAEPGPPAQGTTHKAGVTYSRQQLEHSPQTCP